MLLDEVADIGDTVLANGSHTRIRAFDRCRGLYYLESGMALYRHEFRLVKWMGDKLGNTGIGVCAKNGSEG